MSEAKEDGFQGFSQAQAINEPPHQTWDELEQGCLLTFRGGHHDAETLSAFRHGMGTVFNLLRAEFPDMRRCKAADRLISAIESVLAESGLWMELGVRKESLDALRSAIAAAEGAGT